MNEEQLVKTLNSVGKRSFVEDFEVYNSTELTAQQKVQILTKRYSSNGATIRVSFANKIFQNKKQLDALKLIIDSPRITQSIKIKAKELIVRIG